MILKGPLLICLASIHEGQKTQPDKGDTNVSKELS